MILGRILFMISIFPFVKVCVRTIPPEEVFITTTIESVPSYEPLTDAPETTTQEESEKTTQLSTTREVESTTEKDVCECDIQVGEEATGSSTTTEESTTASGSKQITISCERTDDYICSEVYVDAVDPTETHELYDFSTNTEASLTLTCDKDCTYSWKGM